VRVEKANENELPQTHRNDSDAVKPQVVSGLWDELGGDLQTDPAAAGGKAARVQLIGFVMERGNSGRWR
jgi:hypothetical protein